MLQIQYVFASPVTGAALSLLPENFAELPDRRRLRLYLVGSESDTQQAVNRLHLLGYAERFEWSRVIAIPEGGLVIRRDQGDVLRYLQRDRPL